MNNSWYPGDCDEDDEPTGGWMPDEDGWVTLSRIVRVEPGSHWVSLNTRMPSDIELQRLIVSCNQYTRQLFIGLDMRATHWAALGDP